MGLHKTNTRWLVHSLSIFGARTSHGVATPFLEEREDDIHTPEMGLGSPPGLPKLQNSIGRIKTPCLEAFFMSLESY
jgi:hypothetical protein